MTQALDSFGKITQASAQAARQGRFVGWLRYHYNLTDAEVRAAHDAGLWVSLIAEFDTRDWHPPVHSPEVGPRHGVTASAVARDRGFPSGSVIWLTADTFVAPSQFDKVGTYWSGAGGPIHASGYRVGAYGGSLLVDWLVDRGLADEAWECGADSWNSPDGNPNHAVRSKRAVIRQRGGGNVGGVGVDFNDVISEAAWGQWSPAQPPVSSTPEPPVSTTTKGAPVMEVWITPEGTQYFYSAYLTASGDVVEVAREVPALDTIDPEAFLSLPRRQLGVPGSEHRDARLARIVRGN